MPAGVNNPVLGYLGFCAVKFAGYSFAAHLLSSSYRRPDRNPYLVGGVRTLIGMIAGAGYFGALRLLVDPGGIVFFGGLIPIRIGEWWLLLWLFYDRHFEQRSKDWRCVGFGIFWSYILDVPAVVGLLVTGGVWVC